MALNLNCLTDDDFKLKAKSICRQLLDSSSWKRASNDQIRCSRIKTGNSNRLYICEFISFDRQQFHDEDVFKGVSVDETSIVHSKSSVQSKVIVRFYGSEFTGEGNQYKSISDELECRILDHLSSKGMAPKVYATFKGGRIDEFLENATLATVDTLRSTPYLRSLAIKIAQFHSLKIQLPQVDHYELLNCFHTQCIPKLNEYFNSKMSPEKHKLITRIGKFVHSDPLDFIISKMDNLNQRKVCAHLDLNPTNILVLPNESLQGRPTMDTILIDFENSQTAFRGLDLGKFFAELSSTEDNYMISRTNGLPSSPIKAISDAKIREFIRYYLIEWSKISDNFDPSLDNEKNLFEEIKRNLMLTLLGIIYWNICRKEFLSTSRLINITINKIILYQQFAKRWFS